MDSTAIAAASVRSASPSDCAASAGNAAFYVIFGLFVVAMLVLVVIVIVWAVRHDMAGRTAWRERQMARAQDVGAPTRGTVSADAPEASVEAATERPAWTRRLWARWSRRRTGSPAGPERTAFVLAGGGSRGAVQIGMLAELARRGIRADRVYGASVGAINGAAYAERPDP